MHIANRFRVVRHADHALPAPSAARPIVVQATTENPCPAKALDIRVWRVPHPTAHATAIPSLLVHAPRRTGKAVERNQFKRRTRMALLSVLREYPRLAASPWIIWIRPAKGSSLGCRVEYGAIEGQLRLALSRLG